MDWMNRLRVFDRTNGNVAGLSCGRDQNWELQGSGGSLSRDEQLLVISENRRVGTNAEENGPVEETGGNCHTTTSFAVMNPLEHNLEFALVNLMEHKLLMQRSQTRPW